MRALVTGATGFIGSNLIRRLLKDGWRIRGLVRQASSLQKIRNLKELELAIGDLTNPDSLKAATDNIDVVFNLAAALPYHKLTAAEYEKVNVEGLKNLLLAAKNSKVNRFVHVSTVGVFGSGDSISEESPLRTDSPYTKTKAEGDEIVWKCYQDFDLPVVIIRPTIAYGPYDTRPGFSNLFKLIKRRLFIPVGRGENYFHTIYVENLVEGLLLASKEQGAVGEDFIIGDEPCSTMKQIIANIAKVEGVQLPPFYLPKTVAFVAGAFLEPLSWVGLLAPLTRQRVRFVTESKRYRIDKAKRLLGYAPRVGLEEGIRKTFQWYKGNGYIK